MTRHMKASLFWIQVIALVAWIVVGLYFLLTPESKLPEMP